MKKSKEYINTRFSPDTILRAKKALSKDTTSEEQDKHDLALSIKVTSTESWDLDEEDDFFNQYRQEHYSSNYTFRTSDRSMTISVFKNDTTVSISGLNRTQIESVFSIFEEARNEARFPKNEKQGFYSSSALPASSSTQRLPSLTVSKDLLMRLERYFLEDISLLVNASPDATKDSYRVTIHDQTGKHQLKSISTYPTEVFPDGIDEIEIKIGNLFSGPPHFDVAISMNRDPSLSTIKAEIRSSTPQSARDLCQSIIKATTRQLDSDTTWHWVLYPPISVVGAIAGFSLPSGVLTLTALFKEDYHTALLAALLPLIWISFIVGRKAKPYTAFKTKAYARWSELWNWFFGGFLTFLIFGTAFSFLKERMLLFFFPK